LKNKAAIILLFLANTISGISQGLSMIAIPWYFVDILELPALFGQIFFGAQLISLIWGTYAGTLVDRYNRKRLFISENLFGSALFLTAGAIGFAYGDLHIGIIALCFCCTIFIYNIHYPTLYAFLQQITDPKDYGKITSYVEIQGQFTTMVSGAVGAMLLSGFTINFPDFLGGTNWQIAAWPVHKIFFLDGLTYACSAIIISFIAYKATIKRDIQKDSLLIRLKSGFEFLRQNPMIFLFGNFSFFLFATILVGNYVLQPNYVKNFLNAGADVYAWHEMMFACGAVFAGLFIRHIFKYTTTVYACAFLSFLAAICYAVFGAFWSVPSFLIFVLIIGLCNAGSRIMRVTYMLSRIPNAVIGRTTSVLMVINVVIRLSLTLLFTLAFFVTNIQWAYYILAIGCGLSALLLVIYHAPINAVKKIDGVED